MGSQLKIIIVGAGPAGLVAAKLALGRGHIVDVFEKHSHLGGIWNPYSNGAYKSVRMQTSRCAFHYSDHPPNGEDGTEFLTRQGFYEYLKSYSEHFCLDGHIHYDSEVVHIEWDQKQWLVTALHKGSNITLRCDRVIIANGELWHPRILQNASPDSNGLPLTAKDYRIPDGFSQLKVLVVGGGVSGADIAAELSTVAKEVHWSVRRPALLLPRKWGEVANDGCFSYVGRYVVQGWDRERYLGFLEECMPEYMRAYNSTGLMPENLSNNAIHVNDSAIPAVASGKVKVQAGVEHLYGDHVAKFLDGSTESYDRIVVCAGYRPPDYSFIKRFSLHDLYEYFFYTENPTLAVSNTPPIADGYGTACPYFEAIAYWILQVFEGVCELPSKDEMRAWCQAKASEPPQKVFYDCWLETIRIGITSGQLPNPEVDFQSYWHIVSNGVTPSNLRREPKTFWPPAYDSLVDMKEMRLRIVASLSSAAITRLVEQRQIHPEEALLAETLRHRAVAPHLC